MLTHAGAQVLFQQCMAVYSGHEDIETFAVYLRALFGWWVDQARPLIELCQAN